MGEDELNIFNNYLCKGGVLCQINKKEHCSFLYQGPVITPTVKVET
jgi:hypothetical protein